MSDHIENIKILPDLGIPLPDGTRLSAKVWMPKQAETSPLPAILEYLPYRKSDGTTVRDTPMHLHYAKYGYVSIRVDRRGCGDSEGLFDDEYSEEELQDGEEIIAWIAAQDWCNGRVGIQGISWGGFNGVQLAARQPPALKAVITIGTTVDRYADDIHYKGGIQLCENIGWASTVLSWFSLPPDPSIVGETWRTMWQERLEQTPFLAKTWTEHKERDSYWKHGSICEAYDAIEIPVLSMGGLYDGYRNAMAAMVENIKAPVFGVAGPWTHKYPHISTIEPRIDFLNLAVRWWDRWLKDIPNGADQDPAYRAFIIDRDAPSKTRKEAPGRWISEQEWPSKAISRQRLDLGPNTLGTSAPFQSVIESDLACGQSSGEYFPFGFAGGELPDEQSGDDQYAACFDTAPLDKDWDILGRSHLDLSLSCSAPRGQIIARLCDVAPDGSSALIALGMLNLCHKDGFEKAHALTPGQEYEISLPLDQAAFRVPKGHRLRLALSTSYWPYVWPEGQRFSLTLTAGALNVPRRTSTPEKASPFDPPITVDERKQEVLKAGSATREVSTSADGTKITVTVKGDHGRIKDLESGLITESAVKEVWFIDRQDPASASVKITWKRAYERPGIAHIRTEAISEMWGLADRFKIKQSLKAWDEETLAFEKQFAAEVMR